jgi:hypothetical protein
MHEGVDGLHQYTQLGMLRECSGPITMVADKWLVGMSLIPL